MAAGGASGASLVHPGAGKSFTLSNTRGPGTVQLRCTSRKTLSLFVAESKAPGARDACLGLPAERVGYCELVEFAKGVDVGV
jgi:hypothetical protein